MAISVRRIRPDEGPLLREIRLAALLDSPSAFARTHAEEVVHPDSFWSGRAEQGSSGSGSATFFAFDPGESDCESDGESEPVGLVGAHRADPARIELVSMWTAPVARGRGIGEALVAAVLDFAHPTEVQLWVTRGNDAAQRLYERCGFEVTGEIAPLPSDPCKDEIRMRHCPR